MCVCVCVCVVSLGGIAASRVQRRAVLSEVPNKADDDGFFFVVLMVTIRVVFLGKLTPLLCTE